MTGKEKISYIITYYWYHMLGVAAAVCLAVFLIWHFAFGIVRPEFTLVIVNRETDFVRDGALREAFAAFSGAEERRVEVDSDYQLSYRDVKRPGANESSYEKFFFRWDNGELDAVIMPESFCRYCMSLGGGYEPLDAFDTGELPLYEYGGARIGVLVEETGLAEQIVPEGTSDPSDPILLVFPSQGGHDGARQAFLDYIRQL